MANMTTDLPGVQPCCGMRIFSILSRPAFLAKPGRGRYHCHRSPVIPSQDLETKYASTQGVKCWGVWKVKSDYMHLRHLPHIVPSNKARSDIKSSENWKLRLKTSQPCWGCSVLCGWDGGLGHVKPTGNHPKSRLGPPTGCELRSSHLVPHEALGCQLWAGFSVSCLASVSEVPRFSDNPLHQTDKRVAILFAPLLIQWFMPQDPSSMQSYGKFFERL